ncbi:MAG: C-type lectin domain-containing protein, partial [Lentisphaerae bacterium]|nr:C-type lectin domain-containing protein [Lentisphaerota bacterium]
PAEVAALVATAPVGNEPGLAGLWRLNEGVGTTVVDAVAGCNGIFGAGVAAESPTWAAAPLPGPRRTLRISYSDSQAMDQASVIDVGNYLLTASGGDGVFGNGNDIDRSADLVDISYDAATRTATLRCDPAIAGDAFRLTVRGTTTVRDAAGNALAGGQDVASAPLGIPAVPPRVTATLDPASDSGLDTADRLTSDTTPTLQVTATDAGLIEVYRDGVAVPGWSQAVTGAGTVALTPPEPLAGGAHRLSVVFTPWIGEPTQTTLDLFIDDGGPRVTAVDGPVPTPCFSRTIHFDRPVRVADLSPDQVEVRNGDGTLRAMATAVTPLWPGLKQNPGTGTWYLPVLRREGVTWFGAEAEAKRLGGALVSIADGNEMTFVRSLVADVSFWRHAPGAPSIGPWIGLRREAGVAGAYFHWYWPDGAAMVYTYWGSNQPDNRDGQHWAVHLGDQAYGYWFDNAPTTLAPGFVVEFAAAPVVASSFRIDVESLPGGADYSLVFGPGVRDAAGNPMDQDGDGTPGEPVVDAWADVFTVPAPADGLQVVQALPTGADPAAPFRHLEVVFNRPVDAGSVAVADAVLTPAGGGAAIIAAS